MPARADRFVVTFRKQLDFAAGTMPWRTGPAPAAPLARAALLDRAGRRGRQKVSSSKPSLAGYEQHTKHCAHCLGALAATERLLAASRVALQGSAAAVLVSLAVAPAPAFVGAVAALSAA